MLDKNGTRQLAYVVVVDAVTPIEGYDRVELAHISGWTVVVGKGEFHIGDPAIYFEIDSQLPEVAPFTNMEFLAKKHYKIKTQKMCKSLSQGLLMSPKDFGWTCDGDKIRDNNGHLHSVDDESRFLTKELGITYYVKEDNSRKSSPNPNAKYNSMMARHPKFAKTKFAHWCMKRDWAKKILFIFLGRKKDSKTGFPKNFPGVTVTDQERCENMTWVLRDKTPFIVTQKCDGSSGTFILERKKFGKYEFYVCSRNVRQLKPEQKCFYDENYYWQVAIKYDIENKMKAWLKAHHKAWFVCWQGEVCGPKIQSNPQHLSEYHLFCFHWTDSINGRRDIREADKDWRAMGMEVVPIEGTIVLPDDFEKFKQMADGKYDPSVCEGHKDCDREGWVLYKTNEPTFSFKNVSRKYLLGKKD